MIRRWWHRLWTSTQCAVSARAALVGVFVLLYMYVCLCMCQQPVCRTPAHRCAIISLHNLKKKNIAAETYNKILGVYQIRAYMSVVVVSQSSERANGGGNDNVVGLAS